MLLYLILQKCLSARLSMVSKKLKPGVWGDPPSFRDAVRPVPLHGGAEAGRGFGTSGSGGSSSGGGSSRSYGSLSSGFGGSRRGYATASAAAAQEVAPAASSSGDSGKAAAGPAKGSDVPRLNIGIFGCMNAGKSTLMNRLTRRQV